MLKRRPATGGASLIIIRIILSYNLPVLHVQHCQTARLPDCVDMARRFALVGPKFRAPPRQLENLGQVLVPASGGAAHSSANLSARWGAKIICRLQGGARVAAMMETLVSFEKI